MKPQVNITEPKTMAFKAGSKAKQEQMLEGKKITL
jgi:hypothetical protein